MTKKIFSLTASIIKVFIILLIFLSNSKADENNIKYYSGEVGTLSIMYHRFNENKYPSTNIQMDVFKKQIEMIKENKFQFEDPNLFDENFNNVKKEKKILITIDDAFTSFYEHAWPYLKKNKIPFILFVSTEAIGKNGYMNWEQLKEVEKESFGYLGNHSHTHEYLVDFSFDDFKKDINTSIKIFKKEIGYNPIFFSYPFGEYTDQQLKFISNKFKYAFGQHSGVIDVNKNPYELPRFPINEKYGDLKRFNFLINLLPLQYKKISPEDKYITSNNPPELIIDFFPEQKNLNQINCFSDEGNKWEKSNIELNDQKLKINFREKFSFRRGRVNCSLNDTEGWRWFGIQFSVNTGSN
tara:strand:+ start:79 stop:1140 length:1062 start_codon:yes stop_codon:yes gene_type:complete